MRLLHGTLVVLLLAAPAAAQASFECYTPGPFPFPGPGNCEGVLGNNLGATTGIAAAPVCGMPAQGMQYARLQASGPFGVPAGGPPSYPLPLNVTEMRVPIPAGATSVAFCWDFFNAEGFGSFLNDGFAAAVVTAGGGLVQVLAYADAHTPPGACTDTVSAFSIEVAPTGPQGFSGPLPALTGGEYLSFACWNGFDNLNPGHAKVDDVHFMGGAPSCPVLPPPPANDECTASIALAPGTNGPFSNVSATMMPGGGVGCALGADVADVWFSFTPACPGIWQIDTCGAGFNTVLSVEDACPFGNVIACSDDLPPQTCGSVSSSRVLFEAAAGTTYFVRVAGSVAFGGASGTFPLNVVPLMSFQFTTAGSFGSVGYVVRGGPPAGLYFAPITLNAGSFPFGTFFGIDIALSEIASEFIFGPPFTGTLSACGAAVFGPINGAPSGLTVYGTALGFPGPAFSVPSKAAVAPATIVVP